jgi:hypothetical protein
MYSGTLAEQTQLLHCQSAVLGLGSPRRGALPLVGSARRAGQLLVRSPASNDTTAEYSTALATRLSRLYGALQIPPRLPFAICVAVSDIRRGVPPCEASGALGRQKRQATRTASCLHSIHHPYKHVTASRSIERARVSQQVTGVTATMSTSDARHIPCARRFHSGGP